MENIFDDGPDQAHAAFAIDILQFLDTLFLAPFDFRIIWQHDDVDVLLGLVDGRDTDEIRLLRMTAIGPEEEDVKRLVRTGLGKDGAVALGLAGIGRVLLDRRLFDGLVMQVTTSRPARKTRRRRRRSKCGINLPSFFLCHPQAFRSAARTTSICALRLTTVPTKIGLPWSRRWRIVES